MKCNSLTSIHLLFRPLIYNFSHPYIDIEMKMTPLPLLLTLFSSAALFSASAFAHGHYPQTVGPKYVLSKVYELEFNLGNHFKQKTCFDIEVNGKIFAPYGVCLRAGQTKKMSVWLPSQPDTETTNVVCSIAKNKGSINTRMCTTAKTVFPLSKLKGKS